MFKIKGSTIHSSRGDSGTIILRVPETDANGRIRCKDREGHTYWHDEKTGIIYDSYGKEQSVTLEDITYVFVQFSEGDKITLNVYEKNGYGKEPLMSKTIVAGADDVESVYIYLTEEDTTFGKPVNKDTIYWYDITLNNETTLVCYDEEGPKEFIVYPAKGDEE